MSAVGISSTSFFDYSRQNIQTKMQQAQQEFQQLGQDLQSGNISAAQTDMAALQKLQPQSSTSSTQSNPVAQEFTQLSQDLQSGNISNAQQDYAKIQQDFQSQSTSSASTQTHAHHHHGGGGGASSEMSQLLAQLGQDLQAGNLSTAQQTYSSLAQDFPQVAQNNTTSQTSPQSIASAFSVSV
jgi:outer membrane protein assembly factor BamD (BamD/ComL family)